MTGAVQKTAAAAPAEGAVTLKILIVDENDDDRDYYRRLLLRNRQVRFDIREAASACEGLKTCKKSPPDCIILDYALPDADGLTFIQAWQKAFGGGPAAAIVMVTDKGTEATAAAALQAGAHDYFPKATVTGGYFLQRLLNAVDRARLKDQVRAYRKQLEEVNAALSEFTHTASHDLKAPLTRVSYYCDLLQEEGAADLSEDCKGYIDRVQVNVRRLQRLIEDLLAYSRTLHNQEEKMPTDLKALAESVAEDLATITEETGGRVTVGNLPTAVVYPTRIRQLFQNLINNALKYRSPDRAPLVHADCADAGTHYRFSIRDNGMGIDKKYQEKIFKAFSRLHGQDQIEGSGIGLATCVKVVEMHGGRIWVESAPGQGSVF
ncbi:MAG: response regulator [Alphaproteobacteria bacterium]|nr:response regulator [Alphaproteobacteria bacterium]